MPKFIRRSVLVDAEYDKASASWSVTDSAGRKETFSPEDFAQNFVFAEITDGHATEEKTTMAECDHAGEYQHYRDLGGQRRQDTLDSITDFRNRLDNYRLAFRQGIDHLLETAAAVTLTQSMSNDTISAESALETVQSVMGSIQNKAAANTPPAGVASVDGPANASGGAAAK